MLPWLLLSLGLVALLALRIAATPLFATLFCLFGAWADRCANEPELRP